MKPGDFVVYQGSALDVEDNPDQLVLSGTVVQVNGYYCVVEMEDGTVIDGTTGEFSVRGEDPREGSGGGLLAYLAACGEAERAYAARTATNPEKGA